MTDEPLDDAAAARLRYAVAVVQRDLGETADIALVGARSGGYRIVLAETGDFLGGSAIYTDDESGALWCAARNAQDLVNEFRWHAWPTCSRHGLGPPPLVGRRRPGLDPRRPRLERPGVAMPRGRWARGGAGRAAPSLTPRRRA